jgi:hypothetical protein
MKAGKKMDALAQLALMTKAKLVFERPDTFLSFPALSPLSYEPDQLAFMPPHNMSVFSEFSRLTNALPQGVLFQPSLDDTLWDVYLSVLQNAQLAQGTLSAEQNAQLAQAQSFLQTPGDDGLPPAPSAAVIAYNHYQQVYIRATQQYLAQQLTAQASSDPAVQVQWQNVDEPSLRSQVDASEVDWKKNGFKAQVEQAKQVVQECAAQSPAMQWQSWVSECNPSIDFLTDSQNQTFAPTVFSPYDALSQPDWPSFKMTGAEIHQLATQAPPELTHILDTTTNSTIDSLSFEFCSVALTRYWLHTEVFTSRFWKLSDTSAQLSDGSMVPQGRWPAYITAVIFVRNIAVISRAPGGGLQTQSLSAFPHIMLRPATMASVPAANRSLARPPMNAARPVPMMVPAEPQFARAPSTPVTSAIHPEMMLRLNAVAFTMRPAPAEPSMPATIRVTAVPPSPALQVPTTSGTTPVADPTSPTRAKVSILAFVCKRLPKCPNPDPNLQWG